MKPISVAPGERYGSLVVIGEADPVVLASGRRDRRWLFRCDCGGQKALRIWDVRAGKIVTCGGKGRHRLTAGRSDLTGRRFGRLVVTGPGGFQSFPSGQSHRLWKCLCDCGEESVVLGPSLLDGRTRSCRCLVNEIIPGGIEQTHGMSGHPLYVTYAGMLQRCFNPDSTPYCNYGGRGITVCDRWRGLDGFANFLSDMGERPANPPKWKSTMPYWTIDRIDVDGNYEPGNCRWADPITQANNKRHRATISSER